MAAESLNAVEPPGRYVDSYIVKRELLSVAVVNLGTVQIAGYESQCLVTGGTAMMAAWFIPN